jgi:hypothetical protein
MKKKGKIIIPRTLITQRLESVSKAVFKKYFPLITELVGSSPGIYALYDGNELYYVGKSTDLRKRVRHHLRDRHYANWTHFSLYLIRKADHISEMESLLIRIANPKGNQLRPRGKTNGTMLKNLKSMVVEKQKQELEEMFSVPKRRGIKKQFALMKKNLKGIVKRRTLLYREYKGKEYKALLTPGGIIKIGNKNFITPSAAAKMIVKSRTVNGWRFWNIKDPNGEWVKLCDYKG